MLNIELVALLTMLSYKSLIGIWLQLPARRGAAKKGHHIRESLF